MLLIASPSPEVRRQWRQALQGVGAIREVASWSALEQSLASLRPGVLLLDLALPKLGGAGGLSAVRRLSRPTKVVLLTRSPDEEEAILALKEGARGYCHTDIPSTLLKKAIEMVEKGEIWIGRNIIPPLLGELVSLTERRRKVSLAKSGWRLGRLTPRQREIADLIGRGASNKEIAGKLQVTEAAVKAHLTAIFRKLGLSDRLRLALFVTDRMDRSH